MKSTYPQRKKGYKLPNPATGYQEVCLVLRVPDEFNYRAALRDHLQELGKWIMWERTEDKRARDAAALWREIVYNMEWHNCNPTSSGCVEFTPSAGIIEWFPMDPFRGEQITPPGYLLPPWYEQPQIPPSLVGASAGDVVTDIARLPIAPTFTPPEELPRFRVNLSGAGVIELHFVNIFQGGFAQVQADGRIDRLQYVDLDRDTVSVPPESADEIIIELEFTEQGKHFVDVTMVPKLNDTAIPIGFGGGLRKVVLCGFDEQPEQPVYVCDDMPIGGIIQWGIPVRALQIEPPDANWVVCDGRMIAKADYPELWDAIGDTYTSPGNYSETHFGTPDLRQKVPVGFDFNSDLFDYVGKMGGERDHRLLISELPIHNHAAPANFQYLLYRTGGNAGVTWLATSPTATGLPVSSTSVTMPQGVGDVHNNLQPYMVLHFLMRAKLSQCPPVQQIVNQGDDMRLRQNPSNPCLLEVSYNGGVTWSTAFDYSLCEVNTAEQPQPIIDPIDFGDLIEQIEKYKQLIKELREKYQDNSCNITPEFCGLDQNARNEVLCAAIKWWIDGICEMGIKAVGLSDDDQDDRLQWAAIALTVMGGIAALAATGGVAGFAWIAAGMGLGAVGAQIGAAGEPPTPEELENQEARDKVICCMFTALRNKTQITQTQFKQSLNNCLFSANSVEEKLRAYVYERLQDLDVFLTWLNMLESAQEARLAGADLPCPCCNLTYYKLSFDDPSQFTINYGVLAAGEQGQGIRTVEHRGGGCPGNCSCKGFEVTGDLNVEFRYIRIRYFHTFWPSGNNALPISLQPLDSNGDPVGNPINLNAIGSGGTANTWSTGLVDLQTPRCVSGFILRGGKQCVGADQYLTVDNVEFSFEPFT